MIRSAEFDSQSTLYVLDGVENCHSEKRELSEVGEKVKIVVEEGSLASFLERDELLTKYSKTYR